MPTFYVTPIVLSLLSVLILPTALVIYLLSLKNKSESTKWLIGGVSMAVVALFSLMVRSALPTPNPWWIGLNTCLGTFVLGALICGLQQLYTHPYLHLGLHREARFVLKLSVVSFLVLICASLSHIAKYPPPFDFATINLSFVAAYGIMMFMLVLRQIRYISRPAQITNWRELWVLSSEPSLRWARIHLFTIVIILFGIAMTIIFELFFTLSNSAAELFLSGVIGIIFILVMFLVTNHIVESTNLLYKLTSMAFLLLFLLSHAVVYITYPLLAAPYRPPLNISTDYAYLYERQGDGSYQLSAKPWLNARAQSNPLVSIGTPLNLNDHEIKKIDLDFSFPFFEQQWEYVVVSENGIVGYKYQGEQGFDYTKRYLPNYGEFIAPLNVDFVPEGGGGVYVNQTADSVTVTWYQLRTAFDIEPTDPDTQIQGLYRRPYESTDVAPEEKTNTFQLTLWSNGNIEFRYWELNLQRTYESDYGGANWLVGIQPFGQLSKPFRQVIFGPELDTHVTSEHIPLYSFQAEAYAYAHYWLWPFAILNIAAGLLIIIGFPLFLRFNLIKPLSSLMRNVERVDAGDLSVVTAVQSHDEIGFLAGAFNRMVKSIRNSQDDLYALNVNLETRVEERTEQLSEAKDEAEESKQAAEEASQAKSQFLANMSHELRTPLNAILGYAQILQQPANPAHGVLPSGSLGKIGTDKSRTEKQRIEKQQHGLQIIQQSGEHLLTMLNDILDLSRIEAGKERVESGLVKLAPFVNQIVLMMDLQAKNKGLLLASEMAADLPTSLIFDDRLVRQVLINLLQNAVKFTDEGRITLTMAEVEGYAAANYTTGNCTTESCATALDNAASDSRAAGQMLIRFSVQDTGKGIAPKDLKKIFGAFDQADNQNETTKGVGLGLAISQRLLHLMQSRLHVESEVGKGTTFWFDLPVAIPVAVQGSSTALFVPSDVQHRILTEHPGPTQADRLRGYDGPRQTALIVDDNTRNRDVLAEMLTFVGFECVEAINGRDGVAMAQEIKPALILMDLIMPEMNGLMAVRAMRAIPALSKTVIVAVSATVFETDKLKSLEAGYTDFLPKPINVSRLHQTLIAHLNLAWLYLPSKEKEYFVDNVSHTEAVSPTETVLPTESVSPTEALLDGIVVIETPNPLREDVDERLKGLGFVDELQQLQVLVLMGDVHALRVRVAILREQYSENVLLWAEIENLLMGFEMGAIETLLVNLIDKLNNAFNVTTIK